MMNHLTVETEDSFSSVLELAANNDFDGFKLFVDQFPSAIDEVGDWYGRKKIVEQRSPLMVAATYGSIDVIKLIVGVSSADVNRCCGSDKTTALHCAASGGSANAVETVKILLLSGADPNCVDAQGYRPCDLIIVPPKLSDVKAALEKLLGSSSPSVVESHGGSSLRVSTFNSNHPLFSSSSEEDLSPFSDSTASPLDVKFQDVTPTAVQEKKEYPIDPSLPDIKNSIYATDEFRMFSFKVRPCSRAYSHDWTECPFVHPGENARRRDPRKYHYSCVPCPDFRKGSCRRGDMCEYAHGVFECWLHPAQYRTRLCKDGTSCARRVCFFAHTNEELRPLYVSTGSAVPSPRSSSSAMELAMGLMPSSPSSVSAVMSPFTPPMSPSGNGNSHSLMNWPQQNVPALHLPGSNLQSSRLRSSFSARDMPLDEYSLMQDFESQQQLVNDLCIPRGLVPSACNRATRQKLLSPSNLDDLFSSEISSPRYNSEQGTLFSPSLKASNLNHFHHQHHQQQSILSPVKIYSQKVVDQQLPAQSSFLQASFGLSSPGRLSPRSVETMSPMFSSPAAFGQREKQLQPALLGLSSHDAAASGTFVSVSSPASPSLSKWGSPFGTLDWGVNSEELGRLKRSSEPRLGSEEPELSWVHSLVKESQPEKQAAPTTLIAPSNIGPVVSEDVSSGQIDNSHDQASLLGAWLDKMQLDQMAAQQKHEFCYAAGGSR